MTRSKKSGGIRSEQPLPPLVLGERLVDREIHFAALDDLAALDLVPGVAKGREDAVLRLVDEDVAVGKIENAWAPVFAGAVPAAFQSFQQIWKATAVLPVPVAMVSSRRRSPFRDRLDRAVDGDLLIVALALSDGVIERGQQAIGCAGSLIPLACR